MQVYRNYPQAGYCLTLMWIIPEQCNLIHLIQLDQHKSTHLNLNESTEIDDSRRDTIVDIKSNT